MPAPLLNPDNKLLSWSINDLGLYGAAITPETLAATQDRQETPASDAGDPAARASGNLSSGDTLSPQSQTPDSSVALGEMPAEGSAAGSLAAVAGGAAPPPMQISMLEAPSLPTPGAPGEVSGGSGSGVFVPAPVPPPATATVPTALEAMGAAPQSLSPATLSPATEVIAPIVSSIAQPVLDPVYTTVIGAADAIQPVVTQVADTLDITVDTLDEVTQPVVETAEATVDRVEEAATEAVETAQETAAETVEAAADTVVDVTETVTPQISAVVSTLADTATPAATGAVDTAAAATNDLLTGIGGTDPAAGVETLVGMVAVADEYDLTQIATDPTTPTASIADLLAVDVDAPILGDADSDDQPDDGPVGLFGL